MKNVVGLVFLLLLSPFSSAQEPLKVVTTVKPLQLVANAIVADLGDVDVLIPPGASPHHYSLKPSDMRLLRASDLVIWIGPDMEQFLSKTIQQLDTPVLQLLDGENEEQHHHHDHEQSAEHTDNEEHDHHGVDPHVWMDPLDMLHMAEKITDELSKQAPHHAVQLKLNFETFKQDLLATDQRIEAQLSAYQDKGFVVFHDAFSRFVEHYHLKQLAFFTVDPARAPGAKKLAHIQGMLDKLETRCVFIEPQFKAEVIQRVVADKPIRLGHLDPLAIDVTLEQGYTGYLQQLAQNIETCLN
jgi:zinc transport system substrate-binding protein